jgi:hypothetical protein
MSNPAWVTCATSVRHVQHGQVHGRGVCSDHHLMSHQISFVNAVNASTSLRLALGVESSSPAAEKQSRFTGES